MTDLPAAQVAWHSGLRAVDKGAEHASGLRQEPAPQNVEYGKRTPYLAAAKA